MRTLRRLFGFFLVPLGFLFCTLAFGPFGELDAVDDRDPWAIGRFRWGIGRSG